MRKMMMLLKGQVKSKDVWHYFLGNFRYHFYYGGGLSKKYPLVAWLRKRVLKKHIKEQIAWRISVMNQECYALGYCIKCGCDTPHLQMANKACDGNCYPPMLNKGDWEIFKFVNHIKM